MIPALFDYVRASSITDAIGHAKGDPDGSKFIAGGHTLLPTLKLRLASPSRLIDIGGIADLRGIEIGDSSIRIGLSAITLSISVETLSATDTPTKTSA